MCVCERERVCVTQCDVVRCAGESARQLQALLPREKWKAVNHMLGRTPPIAWGVFAHRAYSGIWADHLHTCESQVHQLYAVRGDVCAL
jgi:hypothetical protein